MIGPIIGGTGVPELPRPMEHAVETHVVSAGEPKTPLHPEPATTAIKYLYPFVMRKQEEMPPIPKNKNKVPFYRGIRKKRRE